MTVINDQWKLTDNSLRGRGKISYYEIKAARLTQTGNAPYSGELYDWPVHIAQKINFDYAQFVEAFRVALGHFTGHYEPPVDPAVLEASIERGSELDRENRG